MCFSGARRPRGSPRASGRPSARRRAWRGGRLESLGVGSAGRSRGRPRLSVVAVTVLAACAVGPSYRRPVVPTPETTRGQRAPADPASLADSPWWAIFRTPALQALVEEAIRGSHDLRAAAARVEQAHNQIAIARADMFPQVSYQGEAVRERTAVPGIPANLTFNSFLGTFNLAWEIDVWGRIRRATEAARADYLAAEAVRRGVLLTLVSDVAQAYFELLELDRELEITQSTRITFQDTVDLFQRRYVGGIGTLLEVSRAKAALTQARAGIPELERQIVVKENQISTLLGRPPGDVARGAPPRHPAGGAGARGSERRRRRCPGELLPARRSYQPVRRPEQRARERREERRQRVGGRGLGHRAALPGRSPAGKLSRELGCLGR